MALLGTIARSAMAFALLAVAPGARGATYTYVITGAVDADDSYDLEYLFGGDLTGATFTATFVVDDSVPTAAYHYDSAGSSANGGGMFLAGTTPPLTATLSIGGHSKTVPQGNFQESPVPDPDTGDAYGPSEDERDQGSVVKDAATGSINLGANFSDVSSCCGLVGFYSSTIASGLFFDLTGFGLTDPDFRQTGTFALLSGSNGFFFDSNSYIDRQGQSVNFSDISLVPDRLVVTSDVPEPAAWTMLVIGFAAIGAVARRQQTTVAA